MNNTINKFNITNQNEAAAVTAGQVSYGKKMPISPTGAEQYLRFYHICT